MATIFTHPAIAVSLCPWFSEVRKSKIILLIGVVFTVLPDVDVIGFRWGIPYGHLFGHRGFTHSLLFALLVSSFTAAVLQRSINSRFWSVCSYFFICLASHGVLDAMTNGGHGIAFFSPFSNQRFFFSFTPIEVSTLSVKRFFNGQGLVVIKSELQWVWLPSVIVLILAWLKIKVMSRHGAN